MKFTYDAYHDLIKLLEDKDYHFADYRSWEDKERTVILRHDVDISLKKAEEFAEREQEYLGGRGAATYFVLLSSDFYNTESRQSRQSMKNILSHGAKIGLHFDEKQYDIHDDEEFIFYCRREAIRLSELIGEEVNVVSMHRPSMSLLDKNLQIPGMINSYNFTFFKDMKYLSDSRMKWREDVESIIRRGQHNRLHILTHAFWYHNESYTLHDILKRCCEEASMECYDILNDNFAALSSELKRGEVERSL